MIILAMDTSTSFGSVALKAPGGKVFREELASSRPHSETLLPAVQSVLDRAGLNRDDVQAIAVGTGPGAFTGLRVGLATSQAWAAASDLPLVPVVSLDAAALPVLRKGTPVVVLADARKGEVYAAYYPDLEKGTLPRRQGEIVLITLEEVADWISSLNDPAAVLTGTGFALLEEKGLTGGRERGGTKPWAPDALDVLRLGELLLSMGMTVKASGLVPCYVRPPDAALPAPGSSVTKQPGPARHRDDP